MKNLSELFRNNLEWAAGQTASDPSFFRDLACQHSPDFLWIGCSDSRVPANEIVGLKPGELFVHRNVGNVVSPSDMNCLSVIQYAVEVLNVRHIIVTGHYGCGGVKAVLEPPMHGLIDNWLRPIRDAYSRNRAELDLLDENEKLNRLCEMNVIMQVESVCRTPYVQSAWEKGRDLTVHGWIYDIHDGILKDLGVTVDGPHAVPEEYRLDRSRAG